MSLVRRARHVTVARPRVTDEDCIRPLRVQRAPRFVRNDHVAQCDADVERHGTLTQ